MDQAEATPTTHIPPPWFTVRLRRLPLSFRVDRRVPVVMAGLLVTLMLVTLVNLSFGSYPIGAEDVLRTVLRLESANPDHHFVVNQLRLPRTLVAIFIGMGLAVSGMVLQGLTRNALAAPGIVGVNAGASVTVVAAIIAFPEISVRYYPLAAMVGAFTAAGLIYALAWRGGSNPLRFILIGIGIAAIAQAITSTLVTFGDIERVMGAFVWLAGSVNGSSWKHVRSILPWLLILLPVVWLSARQLNVLSMGDDLAAGLGVRVELQRALLIFASVALAASAVAVAGTVGFVGLMAPHIARQLVGPSHEGLVPSSALVGALIVLAADALGRNLFAPTQIPVGIFTAIIGVPYFLYLLYRNRDIW